MVKRSLEYGRPCLMLHQVLSTVTMASHRMSLSFSRTKGQQPRDKVRGLAN